MKWVNDERLEEIIIEKEGPILVAFLSFVSIPCEHFKPEFVALDSLMKDVTFLVVDSDENPSICGVLNVNAVPTVLLYRGGTELGRWEGPYSKESLKQRITDALAKKGEA